MLSIVIPTRNEAENIVSCISAFRSRLAGGEVEVIVVDNASDDATPDLARRLGVRVFAQGPERCAQRNRGWREAAGDYVMFVDADMIVPEETLAEILARIAKPDAPDALYVRETRMGQGLRIAARNFERSFYNATAIDGLRVIRRDKLAAVGGYDENLVACEDWDLDRRLIAAGVSTGLTDRALIHNERRLTLSRHLAKKRYYSQTMGLYRRKWNNDAIVRKQFSPFYRFLGVFLENGKWKRVLRHPFLFAVMMFERFLVGVVYLVNRR